MNQKFLNKLKNKDPDRFVGLGNAPAAAVLEFSQQLPRVSYRKA